MRNLSLLSQVSRIFGQLACSLVYATRSNPDISLFVYYSPIGDLLVCIALPTCGGPAAAPRIQYLTRNLVLFFVMQERQH